MNSVDLTQAVPPARAKVEDAVGKVVDGLAAGKRSETNERDSTRAIEDLRSRLHGEGELDEAATKPSPRRLAEQLEEATEIADFLNRRLSFEVDSEIERVVISVLERDSKKVIRKIPPEEMVKVIKHLHELRGLILDTEG